MPDVSNQDSAAIAITFVKSGIRGTDGLASVLIAWLLGTIIEKYSWLHMPGPMIGMGLLFIGLLLAPSLHVVASPVARRLLANFQFFFFPLGAGFLALQNESWRFYSAIFAIVLLSLIVCQLLCAMIFRAIRRGRRD